MTQSRQVRTHGVAGGWSAIARLIALGIGLFSSGAATAQPIHLETGQVEYRYVDVPSVATQLTIRFQGSSGDADLYVREGELPLPGRVASGQLASTQGGSNESIVISNVRPGRWYIAVLAYRGFNNGKLSYSFNSASESTRIPGVYRLENSSRVGGGGGQAIGQAPSHIYGLWAPHNNGVGTPAVIRIRYGRYVDALQIGYRLSNGSTVWGNKAGGNGGGLAEFTLGRGEYIVAIRGRAGNKLDAIQFVTNWGGQSPMYGGRGGSAFELRAPAGFALFGFEGRHGRVVDALSAVWRSTIPIGSSSTSPGPVLAKPPSTPAPGSYSPPPTTPPPSSPPSASPPPSNPPSSGDPIRIKAHAKKIYNGRYDFVITVTNVSSAPIHWDEFLSFKINGRSYQNLANFGDPIIEPGASLALDASIYFDRNVNGTRDGGDLDGFLSAPGRRVPITFSTRHYDNNGRQVLLPGWKGTFTTP